MLSLLVANSQCHHILYEIADNPKQYRMLIICSIVCVCGMISYYIVSGCSQIGNILDSQKQTI